MTSRSDHSPQLQSYFSACATTFLKFRTPPPDSEFCFESRQNFPKKRTRYDCRSPHPDKRKERGSHATTSCSERPSGSPEDSRQNAAQYGSSHVAQNPIRMPFCSPGTSFASDTTGLRAVSSTQ